MPIYQRVPRPTANAEILTACQLSHDWLDCHAVYKTPNCTTLLERPSTIRAAPSLLHAALLVATGAPSSHAAVHSNSALHNAAPHSAAVHCRSAPNIARAASKPTKRRDVRRLRLRPRNRGAPRGRLFADAAPSAAAVAAAGCLPPQTHGCHWPMPAPLLNAGGTLAGV